MIEKNCDNKMVGMIVWKDKKLLLIQNKNAPFGFGPPTSHVDSNPSFEATALQQITAQLGVTAANLQLLTEGKKQDSCDRKNSDDGHYWKIYKMKVSGEAVYNDETKNIVWYSKKQMQHLARRTQLLLEKRITDEEWKQSPGIIPSWYEWLQKLHIIK